MLQIPIFIFTNGYLMKYLLISDPPAPWREPVFEKVYEQLGSDFHVVYFGYTEKRRLWKFPLGKHPKTFLKGFSINLSNRGERFVNPGIITFLLKNRPKICICFGIYPTSFIAHFILKILRSKVIIFADTWLGRDTNTSLDQKYARELIYGHFGQAYIGASKQTLKMFKHYNPKINDKSMFISSLCADNSYFKYKLSAQKTEKKYDLLFSGRIVSTKNPLFVSEVAAKVRELRGTCSLLIMGDGDESIKSQWFTHMTNNGVSFYFAGFISHENLPNYYTQAKLLLLPTSGDCWGVVINEAFISGLPVITTDKTAATGELVIDNRNGYVLPLDSDLWANKICYLLDNHDIMSKFSQQAIKDVERFNFEGAAQGIINAIQYTETDI